MNWGEVEQELRSEFGMEETFQTKLAEFSTNREEKGTCHGYGIPRVQCVDPVVGK